MPNRLDLHLGNAPHGYIHMALGAAATERQHPPNTGVKTPIRQALTAAGRRRRYVLDVLLGARGGLEGSPEVTIIQARPP